MFALVKYFPRVFGSWWFFQSMLLTLYFSWLLPNTCFFPPGRASLQNCLKLRRHFCLHLMVRELLSVCLEECWAIVPCSCVKDNVMSDFSAWSRITDWWTEGSSALGTEQHIVRIAGHPELLFLTSAHTPLSWGGLFLNHKPCSLNLRGLSWFTLVWNKSGLVGEF